MNKSTCGLIVVMEHTKQAISTAGARTIADELGISVQAVYKWGKVPAEHCPTVERLCKGAIRCEDMRPDVDWAYLRGTKKKAA